jgi:superfamily II DNA or RNA helicase
MAINQKKLKKQYEIIEAWKANKFKGTVSAVTGFGKSYVGILIIMQMLQKNKNRSALIIVPTLYLQSQWYELLKKAKITSTNIEVLVINTAVKKKRTVDLLILDEIHRYASNVFRNIFQQVQYQAILGLTATLKRKDQRHVLIEQYCPVIFKLDMQEALKEGYVSPFLVYNLGIDMTPQDRNQYNKLHQDFTKYFKIFNFDFDVAMKALQDGHFRDKLSKQYNVPSTTIQVYAIQFSRTMQRRKRFLYNNESKVQFATKIVHMFPVQTITFGETTDFADWLTETIGDISISYHSKIPSKTRKDYIDKFKNPKDPVRVINTAKALDEGFDIEGIELAVICSGTSTTRQSIQRIGRTIRFQKDKVAVIVNLYLKGTQDERWLRARQGAIPNVHWISNIEEISYDTEEDRYFEELEEIPRFEITAEVPNETR